MAHAHQTYLPAAGHDWALPLYDPFVALMGGNATRRVLIEQAAIQPGQRVLEIGCGTGSLVLEIKRLLPQTDVTGLDPDPKALARAKRKAARGGFAVRFDQAFADAMPYPDRSFDRVFSSFMLHHLPSDVKSAALREVRRVLKPGGAFHLLDFAGPHSGGVRGLARWLHSNHRLEENDESRILKLIDDAGLERAERVRDDRIFFGLARINYFRAVARSG